MPISDRHFALLQVKFVRRFDDQGYFFYVMELSDPLDPAWDRQSPFEPFSLNNYCVKSGGRLTVGECLRIGIALAEAVDILHQANLVHRDIKPANVVFVNGRPKLADVGLVREAPRSGQSSTIVFTRGFADPLELGTKLADMYALAITLYVVSTGKPPESFSCLPTTLVEMPEFMRLNEIICKACQPLADQRYPSAGAMLAALRQAQSEFQDGGTKRI
jgi:serine/threonine protein kinase